MINNNSFAFPYFQLCNLPVVEATEVQNRMKSGAIEVSCSNNAVIFSGIVFTWRLVTVSPDLYRTETVLLETAFYGRMIGLSGDPLTLQQPHYPGKKTESLRSA